MQEIEHLHVRSSGPTAASPLQSALYLFDLRRRREQHLPPDLFGEPAWDILLFLYIRHQQGEEAAYGAARKAIKLSEATMARRVEQLIASGLITRRTPPEDRRRAFLSLTPAGVDGVSAALG